jgi:hypothetical protein
VRLCIPPVTDGCVAAARSRRRPLPPVLQPRAAKQHEYVRGSFARSIRRADSAGYPLSVQTVRSLDGRGQAPASFLLTGPAAACFPALPLACGCPVRRCASARNLCPHSFLFLLVLNRSSSFLSFCLFFSLLLGVWRVHADIYYYDFESSKVK